MSEANRETLWVVAVEPGWLGWAHFVQEAAAFVGSNWEKERCLEGFDRCSRKGEAAIILCRALLGLCHLDAVPTAGTSTRDPFLGETGVLGSVC